MKNFRFRLQSMLDLWLRELGERSKAVEDKHQEIQTNRYHQEQLRDEARLMETEFTKLGGGGGEDYLWHLDYMHRLGVRMEQLMAFEELLLQDLEILEKSRREAATAHRRLEIYRDRLKERWANELAHAEAQVLDEWGVLAFSRQPEKH